MVMRLICVSTVCLALVNAPIARCEDASMLWAPVHVNLLSHHVTSFAMIETESGDQEPLGLDVQELPDAAAEPVDVEQLHSTPGRLPGLKSSCRGGRRGRDG